MIVIEGKAVRVGDTELTFDYPVQDARVVGDMLLVLYRPESYKGGQFQNLAAFDFNGGEIWKAELPTTNSMDAYYKIVSDKPLIADSYCSYRCTIDLGTGRIQEREFYK